MPPTKAPRASERPTASVMAATTRQMVRASMRESSSLVVFSTLRRKRGTTFHPMRTTGTRRRMDLPIFQAMPRKLAPLADPRPVRMTVRTTTARSSTRERVIMMRPASVESSLREMSRLMRTMVEATAMMDPTAMPCSSGQPRR
jgi:hypothetical protein